MPSFDRLSIFSFYKGHSTSSSSFLGYPSVDVYVPIFRFYAFAFSLCFVKAAMSVPCLLISLKTFASIVQFDAFPLRLSKTSSAADMFRINAHKHKLTQLNPNYGWQESEGKKLEFQSFVFRWRGIYLPIILNTVFTRGRGFTRCWIEELREWKY